MDKYDVQVRVTVNKEGEAVKTKVIGEFKPKDFSAILGLCEVIAVKDSKEVDLINSDCVTLLYSVNVQGDDLDIQKCGVKQYVSEEMLEDMICKATGVDKDTLLYNTKTRKRAVVQARQLFMAVDYILHHKSKSLAVVGSKFGKDHATVLHARKTIANLYSTKDKTTTDIVDFIDEILDVNLKSILQAE